jgi:hypothetical protein
MPAIDTERLYDKTVDSIIAYRKRLKLIRVTIGPRVLVEGSPEGTPPMSEAVWELWSGTAPAIAPGASCFPLWRNR